MGLTENQIIAREKRKQASGYRFRKMDEEFLWLQNHAIVDLIELVGEDELFVDGLNSIDDDFTTSIQKEAWNLPTINLDSKIDYVINEKWYAGVNVFYIGERKEQQFYPASLSLPDPNFTNTLEGYFDVNAHLGFKYSERLTAFLRANNITNNNYQKWLNYPVQGLQVVLGVNYKFDF
jgi:hypothetical protein